MPKPHARPVSSAAEILDEHRQLRAHVEKLEAALSMPPAQDARAAWAGELGACIAEMQPLLRAHFAREEADGGLFDEIQAAMPGATHACEQLQAEHAGMLDRLDRLAALTGAGDPLETPSLVADGRSLCHDLARHEERENELLLNALEDETAAQD